MSPEKFESPRNSLLFPLVSKIVLLTFVFYANFHRDRRGKQYDHFVIANKGLAASNSKYSNWADRVSSPRHR